MVTTNQTADLQLKVSFESSDAIGFGTTIIRAYRSTDVTNPSPRAFEVTTALANAAPVIGAAVLSPFSLVLLLPATANSPYRLTGSTAETGILISSGVPVVLPTSDTAIMAYTTAGTTFRLRGFYL